MATGLPLARFFWSLGRQMATVAASLWVDQRTWKLSPQRFPTNSGLSIPSAANATLAELLLETGIALSPVRSIFAPSAWYAVFRYSEAFAARSGKLRLVASAQDWESRLTAMLAEELGVGVAIHLARQFLGVVHIADIEPLIRAGEMGFMVPPVSSRHPEARPDYLGVLGNGECIVFEAKGVVGTASKLSEPLKKAEIQVDNIQFLKHRPRCVQGIPCADRIVIGTHFCIDGTHKNSETTTFLVDPPAPEHPVPEGPGSDLPLRVAYAKVFNFGDAPLIADALLTRRDTIGVADLPGTQVGNWALRVIGPFLWGGFLVVDAELAAILDRGAREDLRAAVAERTARIGEELRGRELPPDFLMLNNGIGILRR
ncbi:hypothetical protein F0U61_41030 [Archangium violaceum]|uniref:hypothetical protein n=1 Tax=Archangium violaceum TaxID=83451 RepID=UPI002B27D654|nr:hypothetical protein F0U61_41030 [Archangium violaceum]